MLEEFHKQYKLTHNEKPTFEISDKDRELRYNLIHEECEELKDAKDIYDVADALGDLLYVVLGAAVTYGINLKPIFDEIHRSNMSKLWTGEEVDAVDLDFRSKHNVLA